LEKDVNRVIDLMQNIKSLNISITKLDQHLDNLQKGID